MDYRDKLGRFKKGHISWIKGRRHTPKIEEICKKFLIPFKKGYTPWNKGLPAWNKGMKMSSIAKKKMSLSRKGRKPSNFGQKRPEITGINHFAWKGGISLLHEKLRGSLENKQWIREVFARDSYTCQDCFNRGGNLVAHHKKQFSIILKEFLMEYNQFSPIEDKETLVRLAINYKSFWDVNNGETLCKDCHKKIKVEF